MTLERGGRFGPYEILGPLGAGGMGEVYAARDPRLRREVALKMLPGDTAEDPERLARFEREARAVAALNHPGIVTIHAIEEIEGRRVIVMERVSGCSLRSVLDAGELPLRRALEIAAEVADALSTAHERGVVHRDLKPANVMLSAEGRVKVLDFGLAKRVDEGAGDSEAPTDTRTEEGLVVGTLPYMSPEQLRGQRVDARTDVFSLGVMLYEMAAGVRPFRGESRADLMSAILREDPRPLDTVRPGLPPRLLRLVERCLQKDPRRRVQAATDLRHQLQDLAEELQDETRSSPPPPLSGSPPSPPPEARTRRRNLAALLAGLGVLALGGVLVWQIPRLRTRPGATAPAPIRSIAVLPFDNLTHDPAQDYFVDGLHDALITELAKLGGFAVTSRNSVMRYKGKTVSMRDVAHELGVDALIEGSVLRSGNRVRITAQLIRGATDEHAWADSYDRDLQDVLALISDVSRGIAGQVQARLGRETAPFPTVTPRVRPEAYEAYLRGQQIINDTVDVRGFSLARQQFQRAVALDPGLAPAWSALAAVSGAEAFFRIAPVAESLAVAREAARKALAIDPSDGLAHAALGTVKLYFDWDFDGARAELERAVALSPHDAITRHSYADYLMATGQIEQSLEQVRLGRDANPNSPIWQYVVLFHTWAARHAEATRREARRLLERFPQMAPGVHAILGDVAWHEGRYEEAAAEFRRSLRPEEGALFERAFRRAGPQGAFLALAEHLRKAAREAGGAPGWLRVAACYAQAGRADEAFASLDRAYEARVPQLLHLSGDPSFDGIRGDPRYEALLRRIGVPLAVETPGSAPAATNAGPSAATPRN
jgi:serine/threonine protein kinase/tetratricopeptide (TPR) repeat protein